MIGELLVLIGWVIAIAGGVGCTIEIYRHNEGMGLASVFIDLVLLIGVFRYWKDTKKGFLIMLVGLGIAGLGWLLGGDFY